MERTFKISYLKHALLVVHLLFVLTLVVSIATSVILHGINPTLFLLTIFDVNAVLQLSESLQNSRTDPHSAAYIAINSPSPQFLFVALTLYITAIFNQVIAMVAILRHHLCLMVFNLLVNLLIFCLSVNFVKTNLFSLLVTLILATILYTIVVKDIKSEHHEAMMNLVGQQCTNDGNIVHLATTAGTASNNYHVVHPSSSAMGGEQAGAASGQQILHAPSTPQDPKILAPIIYCPHYTESVC